MTNQEIFNLVMARLGGRTSLALRAAALTEMNVKIAELEQGALRPWFLETELIYNTAINSATGIPSNFLSEVEDGFLRMYNPSLGTLVKIPKTSYSNLLDKTMNAGLGFPERYAIFGEAIYYGPMPDAVYAVLFPYLKKSDAVGDDLAAVSNPWLVRFPTYIILETAMNLASFHIQSPELIQKLTGPLSIARDAYIRAVQAHENVNMRYLAEDEE